MNEKLLIKQFNKIRKDFPILKQKVNKQKLVYADNSATTQKPIEVIETLSRYYKEYNSNIHRGIHTLAERATTDFEKSRAKIAKFINANSQEIVFTKGTTDSLNKIAFGIMHILKPNDEILLTHLEHHANLVPWQEVAKKTGAKLKFIPLTKDYTLDLDKAEKLISKKTKIISVTHISNVLGTINDIKKISELSKKHNSIFIVDAAQSIGHKKIDIKKIDCNFLVFSAHKMCGPTGVGVLYGKIENLEKLEPQEFGGDMIEEVEFEKSTYNKLPYKLEAGTPNIAGVIALGKAIDYINKIGIKNIENYESYLTKYFIKKTKELEDFTFYGPTNKRAPIFSFTLKDIHAHDIATILDKKAIASRSGHHCAMPLTTQILKTSATTRLSLYFYNTPKEIDYIIKNLKKIKSEYEKGKFLL